MNRGEITTKNLSDCVARLDTVLQPWGFAFVSDGCHSSREIERFTIGHSGLMRGVMHLDDSHLIDSTNIPDTLEIRDGSDRVAALIHDWKFFAAPVLSRPSNDFCAIIRQGFRSYSIE